MRRTMTKIMTVFIVTLFFLSVTGAATSTLNEVKVITVAGDGSGDYNCDGKDDQIQINQALAAAAKNPGTIVRLKGSFRYMISDTILLGSNAILEGGPGVTLKLAKGLKAWGGPGISYVNVKAMFMIKNNSAKNVTIRNLTIDGSQSDYYPKIKLGSTYYIMAHLRGCDGLTIKNVTFQNGCSDAMLIVQCSNILIDTVTVYKPGHDCVYAYKVKSITVKNCKFTNRINSSTRFDTVTNGVFANNYCTTSGGGYAGLELENTVKNIDAYGNYFYKLHGPAIAHVHTKETNVKIHDNKIVNK